MENFFANSNELTLEEQIAYRIFVSQRISKRFKFIESPFYKKFQGSTEYQTLIAEQNKLQISVNSGGKVKTELKGVTSKINKLEKREKKRFDHDSFLQVMNSDPLVNAAFVQYAYAMTVHKAIGSSFSEILFNNFQGENRGVTNENYFRWLYTGITCGLDSVKIINPVSINPLMNCIFEDIMSITSPFPSLANKKNAINFPEIQIDKIFLKYSDYELPENVKRGGTFLINSLQPQGYIAETISTASYLMKIIFTTPLGNELDAKEKLHIVMNYNGKKEVSVIKIEKAGKSDSELIGECISKITGNAETDHYSIPLPNDFRNQVYKNWMETCASEGFQLKLMEEHPYQSVFNIKKGGIMGSFRIYYTNEGFFTKLAMIEKSVDELGTEIKKILLNGSQA